MPLAERKLLVDPNDKDLSARKQCDLLGLCRSSLYYDPVEETELNIAVRNKIDEVYTKWPFYGSRRMARIVSEEMGLLLNRKRMQRHMRDLGLVAIGPEPSLSKAAPGHKIFPYLLRNMQMTHPNQVWSTDITYVRLKGGFAYLVAVIDWYSRYVLSWSLSNTMDVEFCVEALQTALNTGRPQIFNTDQGAQFTSPIFVGVLQSKGIQVSMDGRGRALDNVFVERLWRSVKYENIYLRGYENIYDAGDGLKEYFAFYNAERPHQALNYRRPYEVHFGALN
jgi:putative transposase